MNVVNGYHITGNSISFGIDREVVLFDDKLYDILWNNGLEEFCMMDQTQYGIENRYRSKHLTSVGFVGAIPFGLLTRVESISLIMGSGGPLDLSKFSNLKSLKIQCQHEKLTSIRLPSLLTDLYMSNANFGIEVLELPPGLLSLTLIKCGIKTFDGESLPKSLKSLRISSNEISEFQCSLPILENLNLSHNRIMQIDLNTPRLLNLNISGNYLISMPEIPSSIKTLNVASKNIDISAIRNLPAS